MKNCRKIFSKKFTIKKSGKEIILGSNLKMKQLKSISNIFPGTSISKE